MSDLQGAHVAVVGAGVVGLCTALEARVHGARVTMVDPWSSEAGASEVAAGMIAPALEAATEDAGERRFGLFRAGRDLWAEAAEGSIPLRREGALWLDDEAGLIGVSTRLSREGARHEPVSAYALRRMAPGLEPGAAGAVFTPEDWRLDATDALRALRARLVDDGGMLRRGRALRAEPRALTLIDGSVLKADAVVICAGWGAQALSGDAPELASLSPIKGELVRFPGAEPRAGPTIRTPAGYLVPGKTGPVVGATMEAGATDTRVTASAHARFVTLGRRLYPQLSGALSDGAAGVRAATPDGLPLVGRSQSGVWLATGFRRNGWLLAPLAARITADLLAGRDPGPWAGAMRPGRFGA